MENFSIALVVAVCDVIDPMQPQPPFGFDNRTSYDEYKLYKAICSINPIEHKNKRFGGPWILLEKFFGLLFEACLLYRLGFLYFGTVTE